MNESTPVQPPLKRSSPIFQNITPIRKQSATRRRKFAGESSKRKHTEEESTAIKRLKCDTEVVATSRSDTNVLNDSIENIMANATDDLVFREQDSNPSKETVKNLSSMKPSMFESGIFQNDLVESSEDLFNDEPINLLLDEHKINKPLKACLDNDSFSGVPQLFNDDDGIFDLIQEDCENKNDLNNSDIGLTGIINMLPPSSAKDVETVPKVPAKMQTNTSCGLEQRTVDTLENEELTSGSQIISDEKEFSLLNSCKDRIEIKTHQPQEETLAMQMKRKLQQNAYRSVRESKPVSTHTGWTQFQFQLQYSLCSLVQDSQYHELGPFYGMPIRVKELIKKYKGIDQFYDWQKECLKLPAIKERKNLVYALPTSGGKTLVAEILMLREVICLKRNVLFILPFVAIVQEKVRSLSPFAVELGIMVEEYAAGKGIIPPKKRRRRQTIYIATIEKALAITQSLIETGRLSEIGLVVVDELHLIAEGSGRGAALEATLTYIMYSLEKIHIIGMSATIGNMKDIAQFLNADTYLGDFRPVELTEYVVCEGNIFALNWKEEELFKHSRTLNKHASADADGLGQLVLEVCPNECVLVFCPTKKNCENVASLLCKFFPREILRHREKEKKALIDTLKADSNGKICPILCRGILYGVAYHHSGLTADERKMVEEAFREGIISCICCTSTLAAGVNLPAKRVILRAPYVGKDFINLSRYKQMVGRAGRAGFGSLGESFLICQSTDRAKVNQLLKSKMDDAVSSLTKEDCKDIILSAIGLKVAITRKQLRLLLKKTLLHVQVERLKVNVNQITDDCITSLYKQGAIRVKEENERNEQKCRNESKLEVSVNRHAVQAERKVIRISNNAELSISRLGKAALKGCMSLPVALKLYGDLVKAKSSLVLLCILHILYLVTPYNLPEHMNPNYPIFFDVYMQLGAKEQHAASVIGLSEKQVSRMAMGQKPKNVSDEKISRFYVTLILNELWKHKNVWEVATLFQIPRGMVQSLMSSAASFSWNVLRFCEELEELWSVKAILAEFSPRLAHCCEAELLPLMELPAIKRARARQLFNAGFKTMQSIAQAESEDLVKTVSHLPMRVATQIIAAARLLLMNKVEHLHEEAEDVLEVLGRGSIEEFR